MDNSASWPRDGQRLDKGLDIDQKNVRPFHEARNMSLLEEAPKMMFGKKKSFGISFGKGSVGQV